MNPAVKVISQKRKARVNKAIERIKQGEIDSRDQSYEGIRGDWKWRLDSPGSTLRTSREEPLERDRLLQRKMEK